MIEDPAPADDPIVPESWRVAFALDAAALAHGWRPIHRAVSGEELTVSYRKDPLLALLDAYPD